MKIKALGGLWTELITVRAEKYRIQAYDRFGRPLEHLKIEATWAIRLAFGYANDLIWA